MAWALGVEERGNGRSEIRSVSEARRSFIFETGLAIYMVSPYLPVLWSALKSTQTFIIPYARLNPGSPDLFTPRDVLDMHLIRLAPGGPWHE